MASTGRGAAAEGVRGLVPRNQPAAELYGEGMVRACALSAALLLASCVPSPVVTPSTTSSSEIPKCSSARLTFLVEQFFARYNARDLNAFLTLFNWGAPAGGGGFGSYVDNPGQPQQLRDRASLSAYLRGRWAIDDRFSIADAGS